ncbi:MAG TPA: calcium-binding protein [Roseovarius sp.]
MLLLAGLMGMMALGATAFVGMGAYGDDDADAQDRTDQDMPETEVADPDTGQSGTSIMDFIGNDALAGPAEIGTAEGAIATENITNQGAAGGVLPAGGALPDINVSSADALGPEPVAEPGAATAERVTVGTSSDDRMDGSHAVDVANGHDGDDAMTGAEGDDALWGGAGADSLTGDAGNDTLHGGAGNDVMLGGDGDDYMFGHGDDDTLSGGAGDDSLVGSAGDDVLDGGAGADALHGDLGNDVLRGGAGHDTLFGGWGDDALSGFEDDPDTDGWNDTDVMDYLNGGGGDDLIIAGAGDIVTGGAGADTVLLGDWISADHQAQILDFAPDQDTLMVVYDDLAGPEPDVDLAPDPENATIQRVIVNGVAVATVNNAAGLNAGHITLIGSSLLPAGAML